MKSRMIFLLLLTALLGCNKQSSSPQSPTLFERFLSHECPLSFREVYRDGTLASRPFIRPEHVVKLEAAHKLFEGDDPSMLVTLTKEGEDRMWDHTKNGVGTQIAAFCGDKEVDRGMIFEPFGNHFRVHIRKTAPNKSFKPNPLRGSA